MIDVARQSSSYLMFHGDDSLVVMSRMVATPRFSFIFTKMMHSCVQQKIRAPEMAGISTHGKN